MCMRFALRMEMTFKNQKNIFLTVTCPSPTLRHGMVQVDRPAVHGRYTENTTANFTCNYGYVLNGHKESSCQAGSWTWNPPIPTCVTGKDTNRYSVLQKLF